METADIVKEMLEREDKPKEKKEKEEKSWEFPPDYEPIDIDAECIWENQN